MLLLSFLYATQLKFDNRDLFLKLPKIVSNPCTFVFNISIVFCNLKPWCCPLDKEKHFWIFTPLYPCTNPKALKPDPHPLPEAADIFKRVYSFSVTLLEPKRIPEYREKIIYCGAFKSVKVLPNKSLFNLAWRSFILMPSHPSGSCIDRAISPDVIAVEQSVFYRGERKYGG